MRHEETTTRRSGLLWPLISILAFVAGLAVGYFLGQSKSVPTPEDAVEEIVEAETLDSVNSETLPADTQKTGEAEKAADNNADAPAKKVEPAAPVAAVESPVAAGESPVAAVESPVAERPKPQAQQAAKTEKADVYEQMDARVRTGAYRIVGADYDVKVRPGETTARIARRTLGPDMECYIEVYNGLTSSTALREGQTIKIPKLELKKKKKSN